jgi:hypothetical protein
MDGKCDLTDDWFDCLTLSGYVMLSGLLSAKEVESARQACALALAAEGAAESVLADRRGAAYGARNLLQIWPAVIDLVRRSRLADVLLRVLGPRAALVRGLYFDKPPGASWSLPWHRDLTIAVKQHGGTCRFKKPTIKAGVPHVEAPAEILRGMVTARLHLDAMTLRNGPLKVIPGSHDLNAAGCREATTLQCEAGDVLLMRPLLSHASAVSAADCREHRRIVHLEFSPAADLPDGYEWHDRLAVGP